MFEVVFADLSGYGENVVFAADAPVYDRITVESNDEAWALAVEFGNEFQVTIAPVA